MPRSRKPACARSGFPSNLAADPAAVYRAAAQGADDVSGQRRASAHPAYLDGLKIAFAVVAALAFVLGFLIGQAA